VTTRTMGANSPDENRRRGAEEDPVSAASRMTNDSGVSTSQGDEKLSALDRTGWDISHTSHRKLCPWTEWTEKSPLEQLKKST
jgi:hypothetical protein